MRRAILALVISLLLPALGRAVIIDRIVATVGTQAISESELDLTVRLTAFMNQSPIDNSVQNRQATAARLVDKKLIIRELDISKFPRPSTAEVEPLLASFIKARFNGDRAAYLAALAKYGISEDEFKDYRLWLLTFFRFIDFRFRPGIDVSDQDIQEYFKTKVLPLAQLATSNVTLEESHDRIGRILLVQREDQQLEVWLKDQRARTHIDYLDETLRPAAPMEQVK